MQFSDLDMVPPTGLQLEREVYLLLQQKGACRLHDSLLCHAYHVIYDEWEFVAESPNHWVVAIPENRAGERSDASIVRARREVDDKVQDPPLTLESYIDPGWETEQDWQEYLDERINTAMASRYGQEVLEEMSIPQEQKEQVAWLLTNHPETRGDDKDLILQWMQTWGGWRKGGSQDGKQRYAIPKSYHWQSTTPGSITAARRKWHQKGLFLPPEHTQDKRKQLETEVRQAFREGKSPWGVVQ